MSSRAILLALLVATTAEAQRDPIPYDAPEVIVFGADRFVLPDPKDYRVELGNGLVAFIAEDASTDTVELTALIGASRLDDPAGKSGLAAGVAYGMRGVPGLDDRLYAMSAQVSVTTDNEHTRLRLSLLKEDLGDGIRASVPSTSCPSCSMGIIRQVDSPRQLASARSQSQIFGRCTTSTTFPTMSCSQSLAVSNARRPPRR